MKPHVLRESYQSAGLTQARFARLCGMSRGRVNRICWGPPDEAVPQRCANMARLLRTIIALCGEDSLSAILAEVEAAAGGKK